MLFKRSDILRVDNYEEVNCEPFYKLIIKRGSNLYSITVFAQINTDFQVVRQQHCVVVHDYK